MQFGATLALIAASAEMLATTARQVLTWIDLDEDAQVVPVSDSINFFLELRAPRPRIEFPPCRARDKQLPRAA